MRRQQPTVFEAAFESLLRHVTEHFAHEETLLLTHGFADLTDHAQQHQALLLRAHALHRAAQATDAKDATEVELVKVLVTELVAGHILHADQGSFALFGTSSTQTLATPKFSGI